LIRDKYELGGGGGILGGPWIPGEGIRRYPMIRPRVSPNNMVFKYSV